MSYYDSYNPTILELVPDDAVRICEFGCGAGAMARAVKGRLPQVHYTGVDMAPEPLAQAQPAIDTAILLNLDTCPVWQEHPPLRDSLPAGGFDCIIFGDVLEHLYTPENAVEQATQWLRPGGSLIASIPNVQHWSVFLQLVQGHWPREDGGLFDRTHIRWFTLDDMYRLFDSTLLDVDTVVPRVFHEDQGREIAEFLEPLALHQGIDAEHLTNRMLPLQYVFRMRRR